MLSLEYESHRSLEKDSFELGNLYIVLVLFIYHREEFHMEEKGF